MRLGVWLAMALLFTTCGRVHPLHDGEYAFTVTSVLRDECGLVNQNLIGHGQLTTTGHTVRLALTQPNVDLVGIYKDSVEKMVLDGALTNAQVIVRGKECLLDSLTLHVDTLTVDADTFEGAMSVTYDTRAPDECVCKFWFDYRATRVP